MSSKSYSNSGSNSPANLYTPPRIYEDKSDNKVTSTPREDSKQPIPEPAKPIAYTPLVKCNKVKSNYKILIDPGHGGKDPGGHDNGIIEKDLVLKISKNLVNLLKSNGFSVYTTRDSDVYLTLEQRVAISQKINASLMVSIHANAIAKPHIRGTLTIYPKSNKSARNRWLSEVLAKSIENRFKSFKDNKVFYSRGTVRDYRGLYILRNATVPTALSEIGFMTNKEDAKIMKQAEHQQLIVNELYNGIVTYLNTLN